MATERDDDGFVFKTLATASLTADDRALMLSLFDACYRQANHAYFEKSLEQLRYASLVWHGERPAGFGLADRRVVELPRLPQQTVVMGGLCCVLPDFRRQGLFGALEQRAMAAGDAPRPGRMLACGRLAHPAAFRTLAVSPTVVPKPGVPLTAWQREVGQAVADVYGVESFDPETFVCLGTGKPIGYPVIEMQVEPPEWKVFRPVDRDRGDSLLGLAWNPDAPPGW